MSIKSTSHLEILQQLSNELENDYEKLDNTARRSYFSDIGLILLEINEIQANEQNTGKLAEHDKSIKLGQSMLNKLNLKSAKRKSNKLIDVLDGILRITAVWLFLIISAIFIALPCILISHFDKILVKHKILTPQTQISSIFKVWIARTTIILSGIKLVIENLEPQYFGIECVLACFSHTSSMDAFLIAASVPVHHLTPSKSDLFLIPFFSWLLLAFGGIPVNRTNRDQSVRALQITKDAATQTTGHCVAVAPEGTRSKTGQLLPFKKGPFYIWEELKTPIVPIITFGAFELFPPGKQLSTAGKVYLRFLKPILPSEATSREEISHLLRKRMLEGLKLSPKDAGGELTWADRLENWIHIGGVLLSYWLIYKYFPYDRILKYYNISVLTALLYGLIGSMGLTVCIYIYLVYISYWLSKIFSVYKGQKSQKLEFHSFSPPYNEVDTTGFRIPNAHWRTGGTTVVNNNFIRVTPDRQSKVGSVWSRRPIGVNSISAVVKFRISGQGKHFFGDGLALWIVQQGYYTSGDIHGFQENFTGVGIIFDTFKNTENLAAHRDVTILINDGTKTYEMMTQDVNGCNSNFRYHADRADFSVTDSSKAKVIINDSSLSVLIDPKNSGEWTECVNIPNIQVSNHEWLHEAHIGFTATTGQLADNHDIIYFKSYTDIEHLDDEEYHENTKRSFVLDKSQPIELQIAQMELALDNVLNKLELLDHHHEHQIVQVMDHIKNVISKLEKKEDESEARIAVLENSVRKNVEGSLQDRLTYLENFMNSNVERKMFNIESALDRKMNTLESTTIKAVKVHASWKVPFLILTIVILGAMGGLYWFYRKMLKMHLL